MAAPKTTLPRVPEPVEIDLLGERRTLQTNACKQSTCESYMVPAYHELKSRKARDRDPLYKKATSGKGSVPALRCKRCGEKPPLRSNRSIALEVDRLVEAAGLLTLEERASCPTATCPNHGRSVAALGRAGYVKRGRVESCNGRRYQCKECGRRFLVSNPVRLHDASKRLAADVMGRFINKSPMRCIVRGASLNSCKSYYSILRFILDRCRAHSGAVDRALADGRLRLPEAMNIQTDSQEFTLNWTSKLDRRNVVLKSCTSVDADSGFIFPPAVGYDGRFQPFNVNQAAALSGDFDRPEAFRAFAHYWLAGDELFAGRALGRRVSKEHRMDLMQQISMLYAQAQDRRDVEDVELDHHDPDIRQTPLLGPGLQTHEPYTAHAQAMLTRRLIIGAGVKRLTASMDCSPMLRAAFLSAWPGEVKRGEAHGFYVWHSKNVTDPERESLVLQARRRFAAFRRTLPPDVRSDKRAAARLLMKRWIAEGVECGPWKDMWVQHPLPTKNEARKVMSWLTPNDGIDEDQRADMYLGAGLSAVDNFFMRCRRLCSALERPVGASNDNNSVWYGYAPYNPQRVEDYLTILRTAFNWIYVGDDGVTPAMRLGFASAPLTCEDILWAGERVPQPKRVRRKGRKVAIPSDLHAAA